MKTHPHDEPLYPQEPLRLPSEVMRLERMGSAFPTRLSFMRTILRWLAQESSEVTRPVWEIDENGYGRAVYSVPLGGHIYSLAAFSNALEPERRTDRVIAEAWDTAYVLYDGVPDAAELDRLQANAPKQEAGRFLPCDLVLSRANKSVRLFEHVVESLAGGRQPDEEMIGDTGYLMRTTAVYGNGKFGIADRPSFCDRPGMNGPYRGEMLSVWLTRGFTHDLVEHVARCRSPETFVPLERRLKRHLGIGNSTGLGMAPFLVSHPDLLNNWTLARETALARVRAIESASEETINRVQHLMARAQRHLEQWNVADVRQMERVVQLRKDLREVATTIDSDWLARPKPWDELVRLSKQWSMECQELIVALVLEPHGDLVDGLTDCMGSSRGPVLDPAMTTSQLRDLIDEHFDWVRSIDFSSKAATQQFWYSSEEKLEPRLGDRYAEPGVELEMPLDIARRVQSLDGALASLEEDETVAVFLMQHPEHRYAARRVQALAKLPYAEIHDNLIGEELLAIDMLRYKLAFFGASKFDPKSDRWTRIEMYQGAPLFDEIAQTDADDWWLPVLETSS